MKKILISLAIIGIVAGIVVGATTAYFSDTETSAGNTFSAGKLDLELGAGNPIPFSVSNLEPGDNGTGKATLTNTAGSISGDLDIKIANFLQYENGITEPELHPGYGTADYENGLNAGELNFFLQIAMFVDVNKDGIFNTGDYQLTYNGQKAAYPGFWGGSFNYHPVSSNLVGWDDIMTMTGGQSVDLVIMWQFPTQSGDPNYSQNIAMTDGLSFDVLTSLEQVGGNGGVTN